MKGLIELVIGRLQDKSSNTRKKAIQLMTLFLLYHPFKRDGVELNVTLFKSKLTQVEKELNVSLQQHQQVTSKNKTKQKQKQNKNKNK